MFISLSTAVGILAGIQALLGCRNEYEFGCGIAIIIFSTLAIIAGMALFLLAIVLRLVIRRLATLIK